MKRNTRRFAAIVGIGFALNMPINRAFADADSEKWVFEGSEFFNQLNAEWQRRALSILSAEWWQWALSIPTSVTPPVGTHECMVGQRGPVWFLAGLFGDGTVIRTCSVPDGKALFFPVINFVNINTPNLAGQGPENLPVSTLRAQAAEFIDGATNLSVTVDGVTITNLRRIRSRVFEVALPEDNVFGAPTGIYSPAVDDGIYVLLHPLPAGSDHTLHFHAERPPGTFNSKEVIQDVTYKLTIVPVSQK